jgi:hypothetical protein
MPKQRAKIEKKSERKYFCHCLYVGQTASSEVITEIGPMLASGPTLGGPTWLPPPWALILIMGLGLGF